MTRQCSLDNPQKINPVPPSPDLERKFLLAKMRFLKGESLPRDATPDILDLHSFISIISRPAHTRPHTLGTPIKAPQPVIGKRKALVLLVDFQDNPATRPRQDYLDMLFSRGKYPTGSLRDYYYEASYRKLDVTGDVCGEEGGWLRAPKPYSYYAGDKYGFGDYPKNATRLVEDAVDLAAGHINFADYDVDGDDEVDALFLVHAGPGAEVTGTVGHIWSHMSNIPPKNLDGVKVSRYSMEPEDGKIGVFCHELGHVFGLPDLYDYDMDSAGTGSWDLMAGGSWNNGGLTPAHPVGWCKARLGWVIPHMVSSAQETIALRPSILHPEIYMLPANSDGDTNADADANGNGVDDGNTIGNSNGNEAGREYFLIENRRRTGFDSYIPGDGLMILHVDESRGNNNDQGHYLVDIEQCDGRYDLNRNANRGDEEDLYPNKTNSAFSTRTIPGSSTYSGKDSRVALKNIRRSGEDIILDVVVGDGFKPRWHNDKRITMAFARSGSRWAWAYISGLGWRRVKENAGANSNISGGDAGIISQCCQAVAGGRRVRVYADGSFLYSISSI